MMFGCGARVIVGNLSRTTRLVMTVLRVRASDRVVVVSRRLRDAVRFRLDRDFATRRPAGAEAVRHQQQEGEHSGELPAKLQARPKLRTGKTPTRLLNHPIPADVKATPLK